MYRILAAIDGSEHGDRVVDHLARLAGSGAAIEVLLLNVQPEIVDWQTHGLARESMLAHRNQLGAQASASAQKRLEAAGIPFRLRIELGDPARTIASIAADERCDGIVMGTRGAGAIPGLILGSVATKVVHLALVPVTLVKQAPAP
ncbi:MAG TPA: universal stress protein [Casimicrobiaceae bacterium]|nr:universal stress protein [Casimicrobiaceae bacterium]